MSRSEEDLRGRIAETVRAWFRDTKQWDESGTRVIREAPEYIQVYIDGQQVLATTPHHGGGLDPAPLTLSDPD